MNGRDYIVRFYDSDEPDDFTIMEEVVRCKDCDEIYDDKNNEPHCALWGHKIADYSDCFCSWGRRKKIWTL